MPVKGYLASQALGWLAGLEWAFLFLFLFQWRIMWGFGMDHDICARTIPLDTGMILIRMPLSTRFDEHVLRIVERACSCHY